MNKNETNEVKTLKTKVRLRDYLDIVELYYTSVEINHIKFNILKTPLDCFDSINNKVKIVGFKGDIAVKWKDYNNPYMFELEAIKISLLSIEQECVLLKTLNDKNLKFTKQLSFLDNEND